MEDVEVFINYFFSAERLETKMTLRNGVGVFAKIDICFTNYICQYGGVEINSQQASLLESDKNSDFLLVVGDGKERFHLNHNEETTENFGKYINHSSKHPNLFYKIGRNNKKEVRFYAKKFIPKGTQLVYNYGKHYQRLRPCVDTCCGIGKLR